MTYALLEITISPIMKRQHYEPGTDKFALGETEQDPSIHPLFKAYLGLSHDNSRLKLYFGHPRASKGAQDIHLFITGSVRTYLHFFCESTFYEKLCLHTCGMCPPC